MYKAALFTTAMTWKQPKCPSTHEWIKTMQCIYICVCVYIYIHTHTHTHTHSIEYYSAIKKNKIMPFAATWMDLEIIILNEVSQTGKDKYHVLSYLKKMIKMNWFIKQK